MSLQLTVECHFRVTDHNDNIIVVCCMLLFDNYLVYYSPFLCLPIFYSLVCWTLSLVVYFAVIMSCCSNICFFYYILYLLFYVIVCWSLNVPYLFVIYSFAAYLIILLVHLFVPHCRSRILQSLTNSLFSYTVGLSKPLLLESFNDDFVRETS